jgi:hypothetical protein
MVKIITTIFLLSLSLSFYSQDFNTISDSAYKLILSNQFKRGNVMIGLGGTFKMGYGDYDMIGYGLRPQAGYYFANRWLFFGALDIYNGFLKRDSTNSEVKYLRFLVGTYFRYYLKPKHRTIFFEIAPLFGKEMNRTQNIPELTEYNNFVYGGTIAGGLSIFIRRFELELVAGIKVYSFDFQNENINSSQYLQINLSYIFYRQNK